MSEAPNSPVEVAVSTEPQAKTKRFRVSVRDMGTLIGLLVICAMFAALSDVFLTERISSIFFSSRASTPALRSA